MPNNPNDIPERPITPRDTGKSPCYCCQVHVDRSDMVECGVCTHLICNRHVMPCHNVEKGCQSHICDKCGETSVLCAKCLKSAEVESEEGGVDDD